MTKILMKMKVKKRQAVAHSVAYYVILHNLIRSSVKLEKYTTL